MKLILLILTIFLPFLPQHAQSLNSAWLHKRLQNLNSEQIVEFYNTVVGLIDMLENNTIDALQNNTVDALQNNTIDALDYASYFSQIMRDESDHILARLQGYAHNETEAVEWQRAAIRALRLYIVELCLNQAIIYYDVYIVACATRGQPTSLLSQCLRVINDNHLSRFRQIMVTLNALEFENYPIVFYELNRLFRMPVFVLSMSFPPYLRFHCFAHSYNRFVDETTNPRLYSSNTNYMNDLATLLDAQRSVNRYWAEAIVNYYSCSSNRTFLNDCVDASLLSLANSILYNQTACAQNNLFVKFARQQIISIAFLRIMTRFLYDEFNWLYYHPARCLPTSDVEERNWLLSEVHTLHVSISTAPERHSALLLNSALRRSGMSGDVVAVFEYQLEAHDFIVGYSSLRRDGIAIVNVPPDVSPNENTTIVPYV